MNLSNRRLKSAIKSLIPSNVYESAKRALLRRSQFVSQAGQDFWVYGECFNEMREGYFIDIGAHDGVFLSNSLILESRYAWKGICVEANPESFVRLVRNRRASCCHTCLDGHAGTVQFATKGVMGGIVDTGMDNTESDECEIMQIQAVTLQHLLEENNAPRIIDYMSIDIEGAEDRVLGNFDFSAYCFNCISIERPSAMLRGRFRDFDYHLVRDIPGLDCCYIHESFRDRYVTNMYNFYNKKYLSVRWS